MLFAFATTPSRVFRAISLQSWPTSWGAWS